MQEMKEVVEKALSLAGGRWQRDLINFGLLKLRGRAANWRGGYVSSARSLVTRLNASGIPASLYIYEDTFGLILGREWVEAFNLLSHLREEALSLASTLQRLAAQDSKAARRLRGRGELRHLAAKLRQQMEFLVELNQSLINAIYEEDTTSQALIQASMKRTLQLAREESERVLSKWRRLADVVNKGGDENGDSRIGLEES